MNCTHSDSNLGDNDKEDNYTNYDSDSGSGQNSKYGGTCCYIVHEFQ